MSFSRNDIVLLPIPFTDLASRKVRPAVVIGNSSHRGDLFVVPISFMEGRIMGGRIIQTAAALSRPSPMILPSMILPTKSGLGVVGGR